jgi:hypothetical protein
LVSFLNKFQTLEFKTESTEFTIFLMTVHNILNPAKLV